MTSNSHGQHSANHKACVIKAKSTSGWVFNLRTSNLHRHQNPEHDANDSDADSDSSQDYSANGNETSETQLLGDLDLSSRQETVVYKPNPWTIAKINAASRPAPLTVPVAVRRNRSGVNLKPPLKGSIVDGFKKQAERLHSGVSISGSIGLPTLQKGSFNTKDRQNAAIKTTTKISTPFCPPLLKLKPKVNFPFQHSAPTIMPGAILSPLQNNSNPSLSNQNFALQTPLNNAHIPITNTSARTPPPVLAPNAQPSSSQSDRIPISTPNANSDPHPPHPSAIRPKLASHTFPNRPAPAIFSPALQIPSTRTHIPPNTLTQHQRRPQPKLKPHISFPHPFSSPLRPKHNNTSYNVSHNTYTNAHNPMTSFSSPIRPSVSPSYPHPHQFAPGSTSSPAFESHNAQIRSFQPTFSGLRLPPRHPALSPTIPMSLAPPFADHQHPDPIPYNPTPHHVTQSHSRSAHESQFSRTLPLSQSRPLSSHLTRPESQLELHLDNSEHRRRHQQPELHQYHSPLQAPCTPPSRPKKDAYQFLAPGTDPDAEWSTLPVRKKPKRCVFHVLYPFTRSRSHPICTPHRHLSDKLHPVVPNRNRRGV